jgi:hypothetical protein
MEESKAKPSREDDLAGSDLRWLMEQKRGRRIVWRLLEETRIYHSSFNTSGGVMAFNEGQRNVGLKLLSQLLTYAPGTYALLLEEHKGK